MGCRSNGAALFVSWLIIAQEHWVVLRDTQDVVWFVQLWPLLTLRALQIAFGLTFHERCVTLFACCLSDSLSRSQSIHLHGISWWAFVIVVRWEDLRSKVFPWLERLGLLGSGYSKAILASPWLDFFDIWMCRRLRDSVSWRVAEQIFQAGDL